MDNTIENKARFFAQYWGKQVGIIADDLPAQKIDNLFLHTNNSYLELKPLSMISDEEARHITSMYGWPSNHPDYEERVMQFKIDLPAISLRNFNPRHRLYVGDYLRSKGYALPWMGISVQQMIDWGWIRLKEDS